MRWSGFKVEIDTQKREIYLYAEDDPEPLILGEEDFLSGNFEDFISNPNKYELYSYTPRGGVTKYYVRRKQ